MDPRNVPRGGPPPKEEPPPNAQPPTKALNTRSASTVAGGTPDSAGRRALDGPVLKDLAAKDNPGIARHDARWAAAVLACQAQDAGELRDWLSMTGLINAPVLPWQRTGGG